MVHEGSRQGGLVHEGLRQGGLVHEGLRQGELEHERLGGWDMRDRGRGGVGTCMRKLGRVWPAAQLCWKFVRHYRGP